MVNTPLNYTPLPDSITPVRKVTVEEAQSFKGRIPRALVSQAVAIRDELREAEKAPIRQAKAEIAKANRLLKIKKNKLVIEQKLDAFLKEFVKNGGNGTQAVLAISPNVSVTSASSMAGVYMKELRHIGRVYMEKKGHSYGKLLEIAMDKAKLSKTPEWWDRLMKIADYEDFLSKDKKNGPQIVNIVQSHKDLTSTYIEGEAEDAEVVEET